MMTIRETRRGACTACGARAGSKNTLKHLSFSTDGISWTSVFLCDDCMNSLYLEITKIRKWNFANFNQQ